MLARALVAAVVLLASSEAWACACASNARGDRSLYLVGVFLLLPPLVVLAVIRAIRKSAPPPQLVARQRFTASSSESPG